MFYTKKAKQELKAELKRELFAELERILKKDEDAESFVKSSYNNSHNENNREILEEVYKWYMGTQGDLEKLSRRVERIEQKYSESKADAVSPQRSSSEVKFTGGAVTEEMASNDSPCTKFNKYINTGGMHPDFKSINLSFEVDMFSETDRGTPLFYIAQLFDNEYELYPNHRFVDQRASQRAEMAFDFDIQGEEKIYVNKPCRLRKLMYGYAVEEKGKVSIL